MNTALDPVIVKASIKAGLLRIEMSSGLGLEIKPENISELAGADPSSLKISREGDELVFGSGENERRVSITSIIVKMVGEKAIGSEISRRRGSAKTRAKSEAARNNGQAGGRPPKAGADLKRRERYLEQKAKKAAEEKNK